MTDYQKSFTRALERKTKSAKRRHLRRAADEFSAMHPCHSPVEHPHFGHCIVASEAFLTANAVEVCLNPLTGGAERVSISTFWSLAR
jgi:hypothetical protein